MKIAYFVHDLTNENSRRRVRMLQAAGAECVVIGFRRCEAAPSEVEGAPAIDLGRTHDARLLHRAGATVLAALTAGRLREALQGCDVVMARTLEMLTVADAARRACRLDAELVYEVLDVHRLLLGAGPASRALRFAERALMRRARLLIVSSPAFLDAYFRRFQGVGETLPIETLLVENKVLELGGDRLVRRAQRPAGRPWRIAWMGAIRCRKSLDILSALAARRPDLLEVRLHGKPAYTEFADFDGQVAATPGMSFFGPYAPDDLSRLYGEAHFSWAIDYMEEGLNSSWLLPNRVYESSRHGAVPIALGGVETGRWLARNGFGVRLSDPAELEAFLEALTPERYAALRGQLDAVPRSALVADESDCRSLLQALGGEAAPAAPAMPRLVA